MVNAHRLNIFFSISVVLAKSLYLLVLHWHPLPSSQGVCLGIGKPGFDC